MSPPLGSVRYATGPTIHVLGTANVEPAWGKDSRLPIKTLRSLCVLTYDII